MFYSSSLKIQNKDLYLFQLNADGYGSHTSPTHQCTPLVPHESEDDFYYTDYTRTGPKNAK